MQGRSAILKTLDQSWILFVNPPSSKRAIKTDRCQTDTRSVLIQFNFPPINLMYLSAIGKSFGYRTKIIDAPVEKRTNREIIQFCEKISLHYLLLNLSENPPEEELALIPWCKDHGVKVIGIGYECTINANHYLQSGLFDFILRNEAEAIFAEFITGSNVENISGLSYTKNGQVYHNKDHTFITDLDQLPHPTRSRESVRHYISPVTGSTFTTVQVGKGCSFKCDFCLSPRFAGTKEIYRNVGEVISEIRNCVETLNIREFFLRADNFTANRQWVKELCKQLVLAQLNKDISWYCNSRVDTLTPALLLYMKHAGCRLVTFGMESGSQRILKRMHKGLLVKRSIDLFHSIKNIPIATGIFFIIGYPSETWNDLRLSMKVARETNAIFLQLEKYQDYNRTVNNQNNAGPSTEKQRYKVAKRVFTIYFYLRLVMVKDIIQKLIFWDIKISNLMFRLGNVLRIIKKWLFSRNFL